MKRISIIAISSVTAIALIACAFFVTNSQGATGSKRHFSVGELATFNGKHDKACYVAVDGIVYQIEQGRLWKDGQHTTSSGQAYCGADLSSVIGKSPHGRAKLETLTKVGTLDAQK